MTSNTIVDILQQTQCAHGYQARDIVPPVMYTTMCTAGSRIPSRGQHTCGAYVARQYLPLALLPDLTLLGCLVVRLHLTKLVV